MARRVQIGGFAGFAVLIAATTGGTAIGGVIHDRIYQPPAARLVASALPAGARLLKVKTSDELMLTGAAIAARAGQPTLLVFHGNASSAEGTLAWFAPLVARGYGVVAAEYRGYASNPGRPDEAGLARDADAFYAAARAQAGSGRLLVVGHSLGGGVAFGLALRQKLDALVTIGTFTRLRAMAPKIVRALISDRYDNLAAVPKLDEPLFLVHGIADDVVPVQMGQELHKAARLAKLHGLSAVVRGAGHHPDGATIAAIVDMIAAHLDKPDAPALPLPPEVKLYNIG